MKDIEIFLPNIMPFAPGCAIPAAYQWIRQAAIEFCERTRLWRYADEFDVTDDAAEALIAPYGAVVHEIEACSFDGQPLEPKTTAWLDSRENGWRDGLLTGIPHYVTQIEPDTLRLVPAMAGKVSLALRLKPTFDADELPDFLADHYRQTIADGALGRILLLPDQSFTNVDMGSAFGAAFQSKLDSLSSKGSTGQQRAPLRTRASTF